MSLPVDPNDLPEPIVVTGIRRDGRALWIVTLELGNEGSRTMMVSDNDLNLKMVRMSAAAVGVLWREKRGATPVAIGG